MRHRTHRLGKAGAAVILSIGMVGGVIGAIAGTAGANTTAGVTVVTATLPTIANTATGSAASFNFTLTGATVFPTTDKITLTLGAATNHWVLATKPTINLVTKAGAAAAVTTAFTTITMTTTDAITATMPVATAAATTTITVKVTNVKVKVATALAATSHVTVHPTIATSVPATATATLAAVAAKNIATTKLVAASTAGNSISAASAPSVPKTGTGNAGGNLTVHLRGTAATAGVTTFLDLTAAATTGIVTFAATPSATSSTVSIVTALAKAAGTKGITLKLGHLAATANATVNISGITYKTAKTGTTPVQGTVSVTPHWVNNAVTATATLAYGTFSPSSAVNAKGSAVPTKVPSQSTLKATATPSIGKGAVGAAGTWTATLKAADTTTNAKAQGWSKTETLTFGVKDSGTKNCTGTKRYVLLTGTPKATVKTVTHASATPTVTVSTVATATTCKLSNHNVVRVTFTNTGTFTAATGSFQIAVSGVKYSVGATAATGNVKVTAKFTGTTGTTFHSVATASNADIALTYVTGNSPAVTVVNQGLGAAISPIDVIEAKADQIPAGNVCVTLNKTSKFNTSGVGSVKVTAGTGTATAKVTYQKSTGAKGTTTASASYALFSVTKASSSTASTYSVSGLKVNAGSTAGAVTATVTRVSSSANCHTSGTSVGKATAFTVGAAAPNQIGGATADATAAKIVETAFPTTTKTSTKPAVTATRTKCVGHTNSAKATANRPIILATDVTYQDALSSQYLAGVLHTGALLTPVTGLSSVTISALKTEGVTQVDIVGGPLAVSTKVVAQLETTAAYNCGGTSPLKTGSKSVMIHVTRIWGETQYDTSQQIAQFVSATHVGTKAFAGAYAGVNKTKGNGAYNDTAGSASSAPATSAAFKTAFLASGVESQDAEAASTPSYATGLPILLTTPTALSAQATAAIANLGIKQVVVMGGQLAVANTVVTSLQALGVSVLRIAGVNYTDTAVQLAQFEESAASAGLHWTTLKTGSVRVAIADGAARSFGDSLAGAALTGKTGNRWPQLLTESPTAVGSALTAFLKSHGTTGKTTFGNGKKVGSIQVFGGPLAVSPTVVGQIQADIA